MKAFPHKAWNGHEEIAHQGMDLRDYFAGQALIGLLNSVGDFQSGMPPGTEFSEAMAGDAYWIADAMMEARK